MELAPTPIDDDAVLAAFLEQGALPDIAKRVNMSLAALANWAAAHADLLANLHQLLVTRCKLIAAQLELAALSALACVSGATTSSSDEKLRERSLERQRKAASAILRHRGCLERAAAGAQARKPVPPTRDASALDASMPSALMPSSNRSEAPASPPRAAKPSLAQRLAARRLASLAASR